MRTEAIMNYIDMASPESPQAKMVFLSLLKSLLTDKIAELEGNLSAEEAEELLGKGDPSAAMKRLRESLDSRSNMYAQYGSYYP